MAIIDFFLGERCSTKEAVKLLELGGVLECIPHDVDPDARLINAAIAMRRSEWWWQVPDMTEHRGMVTRLRGTWANRVHTNAFHGETTWR